MSTLEELFSQGLPSPLTEAEDEDKKLGFLDGIRKDWEDIKKAPIRAAPLVLETLGGAAGMLGAPIAGPMLGAMAGRFAGEWIEANVRGTPLFDAQNVYEIFRAPLQQIPLGVGVGFAKGLMRGNITSEILKGSTQGLTESITGKTPLQLVSTIVNRKSLVTAGDPTVRAALEEAGKNAFLRRTAQYWEEPAVKMAEISAKAAEDIRALTEPVRAHGTTRLYQVPDRSNWYNLNPTVPLTASEGQAKAQKYIDVPKTEAYEYLQGLTGTKPTQPVMDNKDNFLFPTVAKGAELKSWTIPTRTKEQISAEAKAAIDAHIKIRLAFHDELVANTQAQKLLPQYDMERILDLKRQADMVPELVKSPLAKAFQRIGILPGLFSAQRVLRKSGNPLLTGVADISLLGQETAQSLVHGFTKVSDELFTTYGITEDDYAKFLFLRHHPDITEQVVNHIQGGMEPQEAGTRGLITLFKEATAPLTYTKEETERLTNLLAFMGERKIKVTDPLMALATTVNPDPAHIALRDPNFMFSSSISGREYQTITDNILRLTQSYEKMTPAQLASPMGVSIEKAIKLETYRQSIAKEAWEKTNQAMTNAKIEWEQSGKLPTKTFFGGFKAKETGLSFGANFMNNEADWIRNSVRKIMLDETLPTMHALAAGLNDPHAIEYVSRFILDQTGQRRTMQMVSIADHFANSPYIPKAAKDWLGNVSNLSKVADTINEYSYLFHIALNPRFFVMNFTQPFLTLRPLVGDDAFGHGLAEVVGNGRALYQRALAAGAVTEDMARYIGEGPITYTGHRLLRAIGKPAEYSETLNRLWGFAAGEYVAKAEGLEGTNAILRASDIARHANFGFGVAEKATITNTPVGSMAYRFRSFTANYGSFLAHAAANNPKAFGESIAALVSLAGTTGIPAYGLMRQVAANYGVVLPKIEPLHQMTGLDMGQSVSPLFEMPQDVAQLAGPVFGPALGAAVEGGRALAGRATEEETGKGLAGLLGAPGRMIAAGAEIARGGETRTPGGQLIARRTPAEILKYGAGFAPAPRTAASKGERELELGVAAKNPQAIRQAMQALRDEGIVNPGRKLSTARSNIKHQKNVSILGSMIGL